jgi:hypothetical protein
MSYGCVIEQVRCQTRQIRKFEQIREIRETQASPDGTNVYQTTFGETLLYHLTRET